MTKHPSLFRRYSGALRYSTGPTGAARIFSNAVDKFLSSNNFFPANPQELIEEVFAIRSRQFDSSTTQVQNAAKNRFTEEKQLAFAMLNQVNSGLNG